MGVVNIKAPTERDPGPYAAKRTCSGCGCFLSRSNPSDTCAPCNGGDWSSPDDPTNRQLHDVQVARLEYGMAA